PGWPARYGLTRVEVRPDTDGEALVDAMAATEVRVEVDGDETSDPFAALVHRTLAAGDGLQPAQAWGAIHAVSEPLMTALRVRSVSPRAGVFAAAAAID